MNYTIEDLKTQIHSDADLPTSILHTPIVDEKSMPNELNMQIVNERSSNPKVAWVGTNEYLVKVGVLMDEPAIWVLNGNSLYCFADVETTVAVKLAAMGFDEGFLKHEINQSIEAVKLATTFNKIRNRLGDEMDHLPWTDEGKTIIAQLEEANKDLIPTKFDGGDTQREIWQAFGKARLANISHSTFNADTFLAKYLNQGAAH